MTGLIGDSKDLKKALGGEIRAAKSLVWAKSFKVLAESKYLDQAVQKLTAEFNADLQELERAALPEEKV